MSSVFCDTATTEIYTLSLHDALPISRRRRPSASRCGKPLPSASRPSPPRDRKSTRLNSSHRCISYAVFCLKKNTPARDARRQGTKTANCDPTFYLDVQNWQADRLTHL